MIEKAHQRPSAARRTWSAVAVIGCLPYVVLKVCWIGGLPIGWTDLAATRQPGFLLANISTLAMDLVVVVLAISLISRWGLRIPGWMLLFPVWVGTGLLVPIPLTMGLFALLNSWAGTEGHVGSNAMMETWVGVVVYLGFTVQAIGLLAAFVLYARDRWSRLFVVTMRDRHRGPAADLLMIITRAGAVAAIGATAGMVLVAFLLQDGEPQRLLIDRTGAVITAVVVIAGSTASVGLASTRTRGDRRLATSMIISWVGVAVVFAGSFFGLAGELISGELTLVRDQPVTPTLQLVGLLGGVLLGLAGAIVLAQNRSEGSGEPPWTRRQSSTRGETGQSSG